MVAVVAEAAVLRILQVQLPQGAFTAVDDWIQTGRAHVCEQAVDGHPLARGEADQCLADELAARFGGTQDVRRALALDLLDAGELVQEAVVQPALPQLRNGQVRWPGQRGPSARGQHEPTAGELGEAACLEQHRPGEGRDGLVRIEVAAVQDVGDRRDGGRAGAAGLFAAPQLLRHITSTVSRLTGASCSVRRTRGAPLGSCCCTTGIAARAPRFVPLASRSYRWAT
ncbi:hypothetical protein [Streptomyces sp. NBC_00057]|uniref:hypothetical protein n=1 Tax=Streptomyces sp. NBC_00057 TaxID=2975634 RepID=UPI00324DAD6F